MQNTHLTKPRTRKISKSKPRTHQTPVKPRKNSKTQGTREHRNHQTHQAPPKPKAAKLGTQNSKPAAANTHQNKNQNNHKMTVSPDSGNSQQTANRKSTTKLPIPQNQHKQEKQ